jgi:hypothetical protein
MGGGFTTNPTRSEQLLFLTDDQLRQGIELMYFAYRGFTADPDRILEVRGYGRAHHRAIHFINRRPGLTVNELLLPFAGEWFRLQDRLAARSRGRDR